MSRMPRYRIWDENKRGWLSERWLPNSTSLIDWDRSDYETQQANGCVDVRFISLSGLVFEQWTGLVDKNGKDIYEGDIVLSDPHDGQGTMNGLRKLLIVWSNANAGFRYDLYAAWHLGSATDEIIGNIHENPDLLKR